MSRGQQPRDQAAAKDAAAEDAAAIEPSPSDRAAADPADCGAGTDPERADVSRIEAALSEIDTLDARPLAEHASAYQRLHGELQAVLAEIDSA
ncbi:MAG: hypothetical protein M3070_19135 [Actinomycetota bacterium]|nr:hypothetical protein [Actinomycetota bacterium]